MGHNPELIGTVILSFRLLLHIVTAASLACYLSHERTRWVPTVIAVLGGGCSLAAFFQGLGEFSNVASRTQPWVMGIVFSFAVVCVYSRGNLAKPFNRYKLRW